jgi:hypothetical protein
MGDRRSARQRQPPPHRSHGPRWTKVGIDQWTAAAGIASGPAFRPMNSRGQVKAGIVLPQNIMGAVTNTDSASARRVSCRTISGGRSRNWRTRAGRPSNKFNSALEGASILNPAERYVGVLQETAWELP